MKYLIILIVIVCLLSIGLVGCSKNEITNPPSQIDLITNGSFESGGLPSLAGWQINSTDTAFINFSTDVPPGGGSFSVKLRNEWGFPGNMRQIIIPALGTHRYRLSAWGKAIPSGQYAGGSMKIQMKEGDSWNTSKSFRFADTVWTSAFLTDTLSISANDTLAVSLSGDGTQWSFGYILIDIVKFERLD